MKTKWLVIALLALGMGCGSVEAGWAPLEVEGVSSGWSYRLASPFGGYVRVVADGIAGDVLTIEIHKEFIFPFCEPGADGQAIWIDFKRTADEGVSVIEITDECIWNSTGSEWHDFHMVLCGDVGFDSDYIFETSRQNPFESIEYAACDQDGRIRRLNMWNGVVPDGASSWPGFAGRETNCVRIVTDLCVGEDFSIKEWPTVPEPGMLALLALGGGWLRLSGGRRRSRV
jgi:hypothetical protein